ncbi:MAG: DMT family transporter [Acidobacteriota bacterium]
MKRLDHADAACLLITLIWGSNLSLVKDALADFTPMGFNGPRLCLAAGLLWSLTRWLEEPVRCRRQDVGSLVFFGLVGNTAYQLLFIYGIELTKAGNVALLLSSTTIFTAVLSRLAGHERLGSNVWAGIGLSIMGVFLILFESAEFALHRASLGGDLLILGSSACWASYTVYGRSMMHEHSPLTFTTLTFGFGAAGFLLLSVPALTSQQWHRISLRSYAELAYSAVFGLALAYTLWFYAVKQLGSTRTSIYNNLIPFVGLVFAWLFLEESISLFQLGGGGLIVAGIYLSRRRDRPAVG